MRTTDPGDAARVELLLAELRLPAIKLVWASLAAQADKEGWPAGRFLAALAEHEIAERSRRRLERHLAEARLPPGKTLDTFDFEAVPVVSKAQVMALAAGDAWLNNGANLLLFGPPGGGKSHLAAALGFALVENGWRVLFARTTDLVQRLQIARRELALETAIAKLDKYHLLILDDLAYVTKDQAETSVLFELISARYERRSLLITANQPFGEWGKIFPDQAMTVAVVDRLVHHATIRVPIQIAALHDADDDAEVLPPGLFGAMYNAFPHLFLSFSATFLGLMQAAYDDALAYLSGRMPGAPIPHTEIAAKGHAIAEMLFAIEAARALYYRAVSEAQVEPPLEAVQRARAAHVTVQRAVVAVTQEAIRVCGGRAFLKRYPLERYARDARAAALMRPWTEEIATQQAWEAALGSDGQRGGAAEA